MKHGVLILLSALIPSVSSLCPGSLRVAAAGAAARLRKRKKRRRSISPVTGSR